MSFQPIASPQRPAREVSADAPPLPAGLAAHLDGYHWHRIRVGESGAAVYRVHRPDRPSLYLKHGTGDARTALFDEMARLRWSRDLWPVPAFEHFECSEEEAWLLTRALPGRTASEWLEDHPDRAPDIAAAAARFLLRLHALPASRCPFHAEHAHRLLEARRRLDAGLIDAADFDDARAGWSPQQVWDAMNALLPLAPDRVVTHGDYSLENILMDAEGRVTGVVDLGRLGIADRYQDLAILWNGLGEFGEAAQQAVFEAYGIGTVDARKLEFHLCLDECF